MKTTLSTKMLYSLCILAGIVILSTAFPLVDEDALLPESDFTESPLASDILIGDGSMLSKQVIIDGISLPTAKIHIPDGLSSAEDDDNQITINTLSPSPAPTHSPVNLMAIWEFKRFNSADAGADSANTAADIAGAAAAKEAEEAGATKEEQWKAAGMAAAAAVSKSGGNPIETAVVARAASREAGAPKGFSAEVAASASEALMASEKRRAQKTEEAGAKKASGSAKNDVASDVEKAVVPAVEQSAKPEDPFIKAMNSVEEKDGDDASKHEIPPKTKTTTLTPTPTSAPTSFPTTAPTSTPTPVPVALVPQGVVKAAADAASKTIISNGGSVNDAANAAAMAAKAVGESDSSSAQLAGETAGELNIAQNKSVSAASAVAASEAKKAGGSVEVQAAAAASVVPRWQ